MILFRPGPFLLSLTLILALLAGCAQTSQPGAASASATVQAIAAPPRPTATPASTLTPSPQSNPTPSQINLWVSPNLPARFRAEMALPAAVRVVEQQNDASLHLEIAPDGLPGTGVSSYWVYALVAPFPTVINQMDSRDLKKAWQGRTGGPFSRVPLRMTAETRQMLESWWGASGQGAVETMDWDDLLETAWADRPSWAVVPFENIEPRWKVLRVDGVSPLDKDFTPEEYPLALPIRISGEEEALQTLPALTLPTNYDPNKLTVLVITGVTALTRDLAIEMETRGITYPLEQIRPWLADADLTHISNEVSFHSGCPEPAPGRGNRRFCSSPRYIELLEAAGADIIELTGNHNLDWGPAPFLESLEIYRRLGWGYYGGGENLDEALRPLPVEHNGNRLVFLGCSPAGPEHVWATTDSPGSAPCDMDQLEQQVQKLRSQGFLPIVTFQAVETEGYLPSVAQGMPDFRRMARAGAVIVSGSQAHYPQTMTFVGDHFVHYGLGNLFFDQMSPLQSRQGFIDRHVFYNGKYLGVELLTTLVEELGQPRPMTETEREKFLQAIFDLSIWTGK